MISNPTQSCAGAAVAASALLVVSAVASLYHYSPLQFLHFLAVIFVSLTCRRGWVIATAAAGAAIHLSGDSSGRFVSFYATALVEFLAASGGGLLIASAVRRRSSTTAAVQQEIALRKTAERQFEVIIESSPLAIVLLDEGGRILAANAAAGRLFLADPSTLEGESIAPFVPALERVCTEQRSARGVMEARGRRRNGDPFAGWLWFSAYSTAAGDRVAAMLADATEDVREQHEQHLRQALSDGAILVGAFAHEIRNISAALGISHARLGRRPELHGDPDYQAIQALLASLARLATTELRQSAASDVPLIPLSETFSELRMIAAPWLEDSGVAATWPDEQHLPSVRADPQALIQVFLNLIKNSLRALEHSPRKQIGVSIEGAPPRLSLVFSDSGPGIPQPSRLFHPFQSGAEASGLGLYVSRALVRGFGGELRFESRESGSHFIVELESAIGVYGKSVGNSSRTAAG